MQSALDWLPLAFLPLSLTLEGLTLAGASVGISLHFLDFSRSPLLAYSPQQRHRQWFGLLGQQTLKVSSSFLQFLLIGSS